MEDTEKGHSPQSLVTETMPTAIHRVAAPTGPLDSLHGLQSLAPEHLGSCAKSSGPFQPLGLSSLVNPCGSWDRLHSKC